LQMTLMNFLLIWLNLLVYFNYMNLLLDTHIILWWLDNNNKLLDKYFSAIADSNNICYISSAVIWEISIKSALGKLEIPDNFTDILQQEGFSELPVSWNHAAMVRQLPFYHKDPFDRLIIAQAIIEDLTLLTVDKVIPEYEVKIL